MISFVLPDDIDQAFGSRRAASVIYQPLPHHRWPWRDQPHGDQLVSTHDADAGQDRGRVRDITARQQFLPDPYCLTSPAQAPRGNVKDDGPSEDPVAATSLPGVTNQEDVTDVQRQRVTK
jgi:hypothetical protein